MTKKRVNVVPERRTRPAKAHLQAPNLGDATFDAARAGLHPHALLRMDEAAVYLRITGARAADKVRQYLQRNHVRLLSRGRSFLVRQRELDLLIETGKGSLDFVAEQMAARLTDHAAAGGSR